MKIVNVSLTAPYNEGWGYQENLLTKWQQRNGNQVTLLTTRYISSKSDDTFKIVEKEEYINDNNVKIVRLDWLINIWAFRTLRIYKNFYKKLEYEKPDFIFIHGCQYLDAIKTYIYLKRHPNVHAVVDNHADETNSAKTFFPKLLHLTLWRITANLLSKRIDNFFGVLPIRCDFINKYYGINKDRIKYLPMGIDDDLIEEAKSNISEISKKYNFNKNEINIVCGGKFDHYKKEIINLMKSINNNNNVHLYVYGSIGDEIKDEFQTLLTNKITYLGWLNQTDSYSVLLICDIAIFPGRHSVIWEQCVGLGIPLVVRKWPGTNHVDIGGNCLFLNYGTTNEIDDVINKIQNSDILNKMKESAHSKNKDMFSYKNIAYKSINAS